MKKLSRKWVIKPGLDLSDDAFKDLHRVVGQLLFNRNIKSKKEISDFLYPDFSLLNLDPFLFDQMEASIDLVVKHIKDQNKIMVYGDYDADGVTAAALIFEVLSVFRANVDVYIPDRFTEGYGLNNEAIKEIAGQGVKLIISVDTGIRNKQEAELAQKFGIDMLITDHHTPPPLEEDLPNTLIINPNRINESYPTKTLAGVGVAYKVGKALIARAKIEDELKAKLEERVLDLVAIGTVADCVSILGENRVLVRAGVKELNRTKRSGLIELIKIAKINNRELEAWNIGFQIAPRLNAAGRMEHANVAFELLVTKDQKLARELAQRLDQRNSERQRETELIMKEMEKFVVEGDKIIIGVCPDAANPWNEGVVGLVAGKIAEKYQRPVLVITRGEEGFKGSGRSIPKFNIVEVLEANRSHLQYYGGHPSACGFSLNQESLNDFIAGIKKYAAKKITPDLLEGRLDIEMELDLSDVSESLLEEIEIFKPYGEGNPQPIFTSKNLSVMDKFNMGLEGSHVKFRVKTFDSAVFSALGFSQAARWQDIKIGDKIDMAYTLDINDYNSKREVQLKIIDIKNAE